MKIFKGVLIIILLVVNLSSCTTFNRSRMLKTSKKFEFAKFPDSSVHKTYKISTDDVLSLSMFSNDGFKPIRIGFGENVNRGVPYRVQSNGNVKIPILGEFKITGYSIKEAEALIEEKLSKYYKSPFVILEVLNKRVYLFRGGNSAQVVNLPNNNTTLFEVLAQAGGITNSGNSRRIKIIRGDLRDPKIYLIDLSRVESLPSSDLIMQANDIIYIDPVINFANDAARDLTTIVSLTGSTLLIINLLRQN